MENLITRANNKNVFTMRRNDEKFSSKLIQKTYYSLRFHSAINRNSPFEHHNRSYFSIDFKEPATGKITIEDGFLINTYEISHCRWFKCYYENQNELLRRTEEAGLYQIRCTVEVTLPFVLQTCNKFHDYADIPADFEIECEDDKVEVHKDVLSQISPVFEAMLSHDFAETRDGKLEITDIDFETVKTALDICYGRLINNLTVELATEVLHFANKYDIKGIFDQLEEVPMHNLSTDNFHVVLNYADAFSKTDLIDKCVLYFKHHYENISRMDDLVAICCPVFIHFFKLAFSLRTVFEIFSFAYQKSVWMGGLNRVKVDGWADVLAKCAFIFKKNYKNITGINDVKSNLNLPFTNLLKSEFSCKLAHFSREEICGFNDHIMNYLEEFVSELTTLDDFFKTVNYAWKFNRKDLKMVCVKFWNENKNEIVEADRYNKLTESLKCSLEILSCHYKK